VTYNPVLFVKLRTDACTRIDDDNFGIRDDALLSL